MEMLANHSTSGGTSASFWNSAAVSSRSAGAIAVGSWSVVDGLLVDGVPVADTRDPLKALDAILQASGKGFYVMKDFPTSPGGRPEIVRRLRDLYRGLKDRGRHVLLVSPRMVIPEDAKKEIYVIEYELPDEGEIVRIIDRHCLGCHRDGGSSFSLATSSSNK